jgi:hypothetical protein
MDIPPKQKSGRKPVPWERQAQNTRENKMTQLWNHLQSFFAKIEPKILESCRVFGVPVESLSFNCELSSSFGVSRSFSFPDLPPSRAMDENKKRNMVDCLLYLCGAHNIPRRTLQSVLSTIDSPVRAYQVWNRKKALDETLQSLIPIERLKEGVDAAMMSPLCLAQALISHLNLKPGAIWTLSFSGDGKLSRSQNGLVFNLKSLHDSSLAQSPSTVFPVALARAKENYDNIRVMMKSLTPSLRSLKSLQLCVQPNLPPISIRLMFCSDGKFLLSSLGLPSASGSQSCPYCLVPKEKWRDVIQGKLDASKYLRKSMKELNQMRDPDRPCPIHTSLAACHASTHGSKNECLLEGVYLSWKM